MRIVPATLAIALALTGAAVAKEKPASTHKAAHHQTAKTAKAKTAKLVKAKHARPEKAKTTKAAKTTKPDAEKPRRHVRPNSSATSDDSASAGDSALETEQVHLVKPGETLGGIANHAKVPRVLIAEANHLPHPWKVHAGQKLKLPRTRHHTVKPGETGFDISYQYGVPFSAIAVANGLSSKGLLKPGQDLLIPTVLAPATPPASTPAPDKAPEGAADDSPTSGRPPSQTSAKKSAGISGASFIWPLEGAVRRGFTARTERNYHDGIDITASPGAAVRAADTGTVIFAGREPQSYGNLVVVQHANGWQSAYGFLGKITVTKGDPVRKRERIGMVGHTGKATRDELHFELRKANHPVDPLDSLPARAN